MRVGLLTTSFPRSPTDSAGSFVLGFARALTARRCSVEVLAPEPAAATSPITVPGITVSHVRYLRPRSLQRTFYGAGVPDNLRRDPLAWLGLAPFTLALERRARAARDDWDAIVSHWALPCGWITSRMRSGRPHLAVLHSADVHTLTRLPMGRHLARRIARGSSGLWFVTEAHRKRFLALLQPEEREAAATRSWVTPMGIEMPEIGSDAREKARVALGLERFSVLVLGRLVPVKGVDVLLRASADRKFSVLVAGDGPERARLEALAGRLGADARFLGHVAGAHKSMLLTAADAFVAPSRVLSSGRSEGFPVALLEAMAHGLPVVASAVGGISELLPNEALVPPDRPDHLGAAIDALRSDRSRAIRAGARARKLAESRQWSRVIEPALEVLSARH